VCSGPTHRSAPTGVAMLICVLVGLRVPVASSGRGKPRPYRGSIVVLYFGGVAIVRFVQRAGHAPPLQNERSVTWRSDLLIDLTFTHKNMRIPGPGPQARCGKGVWSPEDQGDRCRVPRSFGPSGAGREQRKLLQSTQRDDPATKGPRRCGGYTSSGPSGHLPLQGEGSRGALTLHPTSKSRTLVSIRF